MAYKQTNEAARDEHAVIGGVAAKKVFVIDNAGNQITSFGSATVTLQGTATVTLVSIPTVSTLSLPFSFYQQSSLVSGLVYYGLAAPGSNPTQSVWRIQREALTGGEVLFGGAAATFVHQWSGASLASLSYA